jgi:hypothetical protein
MALNRHRRSPSAYWDPMKQSRHLLTTKAFVVAEELNPIRVPPRMLLRGLPWWVRVLLACRPVIAQTCHFSRLM